MGVPQLKWFLEQSMIPILSYLNKLQHWRGKQGSMIFTCNHTLDNINSLEAMTPVTLGPFIPIWYEIQLNCSNAIGIQDTSVSKLLNMTGTYNATLISKSELILYNITKEVIILVCPIRTIRFDIFFCYPLVNKTSITQRRSPGC